jgi:hypothetical protein
MLDKTEEDIIQRAISDIFDNLRFISPQDLAYHLVKYDFDYSGTLIDEMISEHMVENRKREEEKNTKTTWTLNVEEDPVTGDGILTFPEDLLEKAGWKEGDTIVWIDNKDGSYNLEKKNNV